MLDRHTYHIYSSVPCRQFRRSWVIVLIRLVAAEAGSLDSKSNAERFSVKRHSSLSESAVRYLSVSCVDFAHKWLVAAAFSILNV